MLPGFLLWLPDAACVFVLLSLRGDYSSMCTGNSSNYCSLLWDFLKDKCCHYVCAKNIQYQCYKVYLYASIPALMMQIIEFTRMLLLFICQLNDSQNSSHDEVRNDTTVCYYLRCDSAFTASAWLRPKNRFKYIFYFGVLCSTCTVEHV